MALVRGGVRLEISRASGHWRSQTDNCVNIKFLGVDEQARITAACADKYVVPGTVLLRYNVGPSTVPAARYSACCLRISINTMVAHPFPSSHSREVQKQQQIYA